MSRFGLFFLVVSIFSLLFAGCSSQRNEDFIPSEDQAKAALDVALKAWAQGDINHLVAGAKPAIMVSDGHRTPGRALKQYEILGSVPGEAPRCFAVRMTLENPSATIRERYVVVGIDPIWILRYEDYEMLTHWSHPMTPDQKGTARRN